jgi:sulfur-oxidizing protein SoxY
MRGGFPDRRGEAASSAFSMIARGGRITRRSLVCAGVLGAAASAVWGRIQPAMAAPSVDAAVADLLGGREPRQSGQLRLDLPASFDFGTTIPLGIAVDSPMTETQHVRRVSVFAAGNPFPEVASVDFTPANGRAAACRSHQRRRFRHCSR